MQGCSLGRGENAGERKSREELVWTGCNTPFPMPGDALSMWTGADGEEEEVLEWRTGTWEKGVGEVLIFIFFPCYSLSKSALISNTLSKFSSCQIYFACDVDNWFPCLYLALLTFSSFYFLILSCWGEGVAEQLDEQLIASQDQVNT